MREERGGGSSWSRTYTDQKNKKEDVRHCYAKATKREISKITGSGKKKKKHGIGGR